MSMDSKIIECEIEYSKCFSEVYENDNIIRFRDNQLIDMYYHNYAYIKNVIDEVNFKQIIEDEISLRLNEDSSFCNILTDSFIHNSWLSSLIYKPEISRNGYYSFDVTRFSELKAISDCEIKRVSNQEMIDDVLFCDLQFDEAVHGKDFCTRRCYRRGKVYVSDKGVNSYVCYHNGNIIGTCNLFMYNGTAKIEDFAVLPTYQRKGYGTTILKSLIDIAIKENSHTIYLVTDEDDTAKDMYGKIGFKKVGERTDLLFKL